MTDDLRTYISKLDIQEIRLTNGDHIIAEVIWDRESEEIVIKDPLLLMGDKSVTEWFAFTDSQYFSIDKSSIIASGTLDFNSKAYFCRLVLSRNIKSNLMNGSPQSQEDLDMLREVVQILGQEHGVTTDDGDEVVYEDWADQVDTNKVH